MKTQNPIASKFLLLFVILILNSNKNSVKAQTFSCPYTLDNSAMSCTVVMPWTISCNTPPSTCNPCASGQVTITPGNTATIPPTCASCLLNCTGCDITVRLIKIDAAFLTPPILVNSSNTSASNAGNAGNCCVSPQIPTLYWTSTSTRLVCQ